MISEYILKQLSLAKYKLIKDGTYFGEIPALKGVWANGKTLEACREELREIIKEYTENNFISYAYNQ